MGCGLFVGRWWGQELVCGMLVWAEGASGIAANATYTRAGGTRQRAKGIAQGRSLAYITCPKVSGC